MDLWIRSQDKLNLTKVRNIWIEKSGQYYGIFDDSVRYYIGMYKTKERALEVLDEIQRLLYDEKIIKVKDCILNKETISNINKLIKRGYLPLNNSVDIKPISCLVYEMPKE